MSFLGNTALRTAVLQSISDPTLTFARDFAGDLALNGGIGPDINFARASNGTFIDSSSRLQTAANDVARFDHDLATGTSLGLTIEEARIWRALHNRDHTNAVWVASNMTQAKDATGLDGVANSATTLTATAANATSFQTVTVSSAEFTNSYYVKRVTGSGDIDITDNNGTNFTTLTGLSSTDWTRHNITRTQANPVIGVRIVTSGDAVEVDFVGLEPGAFPSSAVEVTSSTVTRATDVPLITDMSWFNQLGPGTALVVASKPFLIPAGLEEEYFEISDVSFSNFLIFQAVSANTSRIDGSGFGNIVGEPIVAGVEKKMAVAWDTNDIQFTDDGVSETPITSYTIAGPMTRVDIGRFHNGGSTLNGHIAEIRYFNVRKPNSFLTSITS